MKAQLMKSVTDRIAWVIASGFFAGALPRAQGTAGSVLALLVWQMLPAPFGLPFKIALLFSLSILGFIAIRHCLIFDNEEDPGWITVDEWIGMWLSLMIIGDTRWRVAVLGFVAFRIFDIAKPFPIRRFERIPGATGVIMDDVVAGIFAGVVTTVIVSNLGW